VPQIWIGERHIGGCDDLYALERDGQLDPLLKGS
jgi:glutaredoxin 3